MHQAARKNHWLKVVTSLLSTLYLPPSTEDFVSCKCPPGKPSSLHGRASAASDESGTCKLPCVTGSCSQGALQNYRKALFDSWCCLKVKRSIKWEGWAGRTGLWTIILFQGDLGFDAWFWLNLFTVQGKLNSTCPNYLWYGPRALHHVLSLWSLGDKSMW